MNKGELVSTITAKTDVTQKQADTILNAFIDTIIEAVASGEKVTLVGFGTFDKRERASRNGRNPRTGETITIPATSVPGFSAGKLFKDRVVEEVGLKN